MRDGAWFSAEVILRHAWFLLAAGLGLTTFAGCDSHVIAHGDLDEIGERGNYPEPAETRCGELPAGVEPIAGLASAWVILALPDAVGSDGDPVPAGAAKVRLADHALTDCDSAFFNFSCSGQACDWGMSFTLPALESGATHDLTELEADDFTVMRETFLADPGDAGVAVLRRVTPDCVVGELVGLEDGNTPMPASGGFVAEVCRRQCIPGEGVGC